MLSDHLEKLKHFVGEVKSDSIRSYAVSHNLSQPSVSKSIQLIEEAIEASLLIRSKDGIEFTAAVRALFDFSASLLVKTTEVESIIRSAGKVKLNGVLTMCTYQSIAVYFVPKFIRYIRKTQEGRNLHLVTAPSVDLVKGVRSGKLDFIVSIDQPDVPELFNSVIFDDAYSLCPVLKITIEVL